jgi:hypothetical protein
MSDDSTPAAPAPGVPEATLAIQRSRGPGRFAVGHGQPQANGPRVPRPAGNRFKQPLPDADSPRARVHPHAPHHRSLASLSEEKATRHPEASPLIDSHEHGAVVGELALGSPALPELRTKNGFALERRRERIRRVRQRPKPGLAKQATFTSTEPSNLHDAGPSALALIIARDVRQPGTHRQRGNRAGHHDRPGWPGGGSAHQDLGAEDRARPSRTRRTP